MWGSRMPISDSESAKEETSFSSGPNLFAEVSDVVKKTAQIAEKHPVEASFAGAGVVAMIGFVAATKGKTAHSFITASESLPKRSQDLTLSLVPKEISPLTNSAQSNGAGMLSRFRREKDELPQHISLDGLLGQQTSEKILRGQSRVFAFDSAFKPCIDIDDKPTLFLQVGLSKAGSLEFKSMTAGRPLHVLSTKMHFDGNNENRWNTSYSLPYGKTQSITIRDIGKDQFLWASVAAHDLRYTSTILNQKKGVWALGFELFKEGRVPSISTRVYPT